MRHLVAPLLSLVSVGTPLACVEQHTPVEDIGVVLEAFVPGLRLTDRGADVARRFPTASFQEYRGYSWSIMDSGQHTRAILVRFDVGESGVPPASRIEVVEVAWRSASASSLVPVIRAKLDSLTRGAVPTEGCVGSDFGIPTRVLYWKDLSGATAAVQLPVAGVDYGPTGAGGVRLVVLPPRRDLADYFAAGWEPKPCRTAE